MGQRHRSFAKGLESEARNCKQRDVMRRWVAWMKKVRKIRWHGVMTEMLKTKTSNFVLDRDINWKPEECSEQ